MIRQPHLKKATIIKAQQGFTLIELLVTISIIAITAIITIPIMQNQFATKRIQNTSSAIVDAVKYAKSQALVTRSDISIDIDTSTNSICVYKDTCSTGKLMSYPINKESTIDAKLLAPTTLKISREGRVTQSDGTSIAENSYYEICDNKVMGESGYKVVISPVGQAQIYRSGVTCS